jgi:hypothetical protein
MFAAVRHPDIATLGVIPHGALEHHQCRGWYRVSPWCPEPGDIYLPDYAEAFDDLDAEPDKTASPALPATDKEQGA